MWKIFRLFCLWALGVLEEVKIIETVHIETSNGRNCSTCNKSSVCKYQERVIADVEKMIAALEKKEIPLLVNINCREWGGEKSGILR